jgi:hypothetical protein
LLPVLLGDGIKTRFGAIVGYGLSSLTPG